jgi:predicted DNA-binding transcriptional regulator AlpA
MAAPEPRQLDTTVIDEIADRLSDAIVTRVLEALRSERIITPAPSTVTWLDAHEVAQRLGVSREWVYEHADDLGASRLGTGARPRLRFPPQVVDQRGNGASVTETPSQQAKRRPKPSGLIPIHPS